MPFLARSRGGAAPGRLRISALGPRPLLALDVASVIRATMATCAVPREADEAWRIQGGGPIVAPTGAQSAAVAAPTMHSFAGRQYDVSVHRPSRLLLRDIEPVFRPDLDAAFQASAGQWGSKEEFLRERLLVMPVWQPSTLDLSVISDEVSAERKELCRQFVEWFESLKAKLPGHWLDASDPRTGQAMFGTDTSATYNELEGLTSCLKYKFEPFGCCGIVMHPAWRRNAYPVSVFTTAPAEELLDAVERTSPTVAA